MRKMKISEIIGDIDEEYINEATEYVKVKRSFRDVWLKWGGLFLGLVVILLAGGKLISYFKQSKVDKPRELVTLEGMNRPYVDYEFEKISPGFILGSTWPTEYLSPSECCDFLTFGGNYYTMHGYAEASVIGELLGEGECKIFDGELRGHDNLLGTGMFEV